MIAGVVVLHIWALHVVGQNNPTGIEVKTKSDTVPMTPYAVMKDFVGLSVFVLLFAWFVFFAPDYLGHADNYIEANPLATPPHIVPEWYYLPFYAILRAIPNKLGGVVAMFSAILILAFIPWLDTSRVQVDALPADLQVVLLVLHLLDRWRSAISAPSRRRAPTSTGRASSRPTTSSTSSWSCRSSGCWRRRARCRGRSPSRCWAKEPAARRLAPLPRPRSAEMRGT